ncbi:hypothetical protein SAMN05421690_101440 [Nitrosomonas sp. Nm51]|uniref:hypothetical protein n=1 Tax=Nitrosomonas sp. Nm51 TaxID=133720 RepID=UPI0008C9C2CD|nr:hypothetical protein [Nitrosomonas sp. Nm51]SER24923.1 hypothetical protein SAMN05421690_101440 [Nitrosomonas sp. Nm51]
MFMAGWFGEEDYHVQDNIDQATHRINVIAWNHREQSLEKYSLDFAANTRVY